jgi:endoglucanase
MSIILPIALTGLALVNCRSSDTDKTITPPVESRAYEGPSQMPGPDTVTQPPYGRLTVRGSNLMGAAGEPVQLKGMSSHGMQWYGDLINRESLQYFRDDWNANLVRIAMYTAEGGYAEDPAIKDEVIRAVNLSIELGLYVIIDWHILSDNDPMIHKELAKAFFNEMAERYGRYPHVLFEIANEPHGETAAGDPVKWSNIIKPYAQEVIPVIRRHAPESIVIVGTGNYSLEINDPQNDPLDFANVMYTVHFYAGGIDPETGETGYKQTGVEWLQNNMQEALKAGIPIFVTEWGTSGWDGNSGNDFCTAYQWVRFMAKHKISWANWSISTKDETSASLTGKFSPKKPHDGLLTPSGRFIREAIRGQYDRALTVVEQGKGCP